MQHRLAMAVLLVSVSGVIAGPASAGITAVSASGPGGTVSSLTIGSTFSTGDSVNFDATYTSAKQIVLTLHLNGSGNYVIGEPNGHVANDTGAAFPSFHAYLVGAPAGSTFNEAGWNSSVFSGGAGFSPPFPNSTEITFNGPPGLGAGATANIDVGFSTPDSGSQIIKVVLTPAAVPEPGAWVMMLAGLGGLGAALRSRRRRAAVFA